MYVRNVLQRFCHALSAKKEPLPDDTTSLRKKFFDLLTARKQQTVIVVDAVNQMNDADDAYAMRWIPKPLPPHVHLIVSTLKHETSCYDNLLSRFPEAKYAQL